MTNDVLNLSLQGIGRWLGTRLTPPVLRVATEDLVQGFLRFFIKDIKRNAAKSTNQPLVM